MEVIHSFWDDKNLGTKTYEVIIEKNDSTAQFEKVSSDLFDKKDAGYVVVKVPVNLPSFLYHLPKQGFVFVEAGLKIVLKKRDYRCPSIIDRMSKNTTISLVDEKRLPRLFEEIQKGMFKTDRIAIDESFSLQTSNERYINWLRSLFENDQKIIEVFLKNEPLGFFIVKPGSNKHFHGILTGLYRDFENSGYGSVLMKKLKDYVWENGADTYIAQVSSNNLGALRSNLVFGGMVESITYSFVKKNDIKGS